MTRTRTVLAAALSAAVLAAASPAAAQEAGVVEGPGIKVGEGTVLHPVLGVESGVIHNIFYEEGDPSFSGLIRIIAEFGLGSLTEQRLAPAPSDGEGDAETAKPAPQGGIKFRADARFAYEEFLNGNDNIQAQRNLTFGIRLRGHVRPENTFSLQFDEDLRREVRPTNFESRGDLARFVNRLLIQGNYQPQGRALFGHLRYQNTLDVFERDTLSFANRWQHTLGTRLNWQWLPATRFYADASIGFFSALSDSTKPSSMPLRIMTGAQTALTVNTTLSAKLGFGKGFYSAGPDFTNVLYGAQFGYRFSPQSRATFMYDYDFGDSINANFFRDHAFQAQLSQQIDRWTLSLAAEARLRLYRGVSAIVPGASADDRSDFILAVPLGATYNFSDRLAGNIDYRLVTDQTDFRYMTDGFIDDPSYTRHELMAGIRGAL
ncbi:MAG: hypothetical protein KA190_25300 [Kofleriaceae bacterium]|nr:hypothetical protein [Kofleriaceae bacterium]